MAMLCRHPTPARPARSSLPVASAVSARATAARAGSSAPPPRPESRVSAAWPWPPLLAPGCTLLGFPAAVGTAARLLGAALAFRALCSSAPHGRPRFPPGPCPAGAACSARHCPSPAACLLRGLLASAASSRSPCRLLSLSSPLAPALPRTPCLSRRRVRRAHDYSPLVSAVLRLLALPPCPPPALSGSIKPSWMVSLFAAPPPLPVPRRGCAALAPTPLLGPVHQPAPSQPASPALVPLGSAA